MAAISYNEASWDAKQECKESKVFLEVEAEDTDGTRKGLGKIVIKVR